MNNQSVIVIKSNTLKPSHAIALQRAAQEHKIKFQLVGVVPQIPTLFYQVPSTREIDKTLIKETEVEIEKLGHLLGVPKSEQKTIREADKTLQEFAKEMNAHLIIDDKDDNFIARIQNFITGKKPHKVEDKVPSLNTQEYLAAINSFSQTTRQKKPKSALTNIISIFNRLSGKKTPKNETKGTPRVIH